MELWLFFTIFGSVVTVPAGLLFLLLNRFKNTIVVLDKHNGALRKIIITDKILETGKIEKYKGKEIIPIEIDRKDVYYGAWRRWIIKGELESKKRNITDKEVEDYLNNEDLLKLYLAGKFKDTLILFLIIILGAVIISAFVNGYLTSTHQCILTPTNQTTQYLQAIVRSSLINITG